jgi:hypothetical protein
MIWYLVAGLLVLAIGIWLRRQQARFIAGLRAAGDPLADAPGSKTFRQRFQAWLFGLDGAGPAPARSLLTVLMVLLLAGLAAWSLVPGLLG